MKGPRRFKGTRSRQTRSGSYRTSIDFYMAAIEACALVSAIAQYAGYNGKVYMDSIVSHQPKHRAAIAEMDEKVYIDR